MEYRQDWFPSLWDWMGALCSQQEIAISEIVKEEVQQKCEGCVQFLTDHRIKILEVDAAIIGRASAIKRQLGIENDQYHSKGVGENDIIIVATACEHDVVLVSEEAKQLVLPPTKAKYKIPAVCTMAGGVSINFVEFLAQHGQRFG